jgi:hypothetical protein
MIDTGLSVAHVVEFVVDVMVDPIVVAVDGENHH